MSFGSSFGLSSKPLWADCSCWQRGLQPGLLPSSSASGHLGALGEAPAFSEPQSSLRKVGPCRPGGGRVCVKQEPRGQTGSGVVPAFTPAGVAVESAPARACWHRRGGGLGPGTVDCPLAEAGRCRGPSQLLAVLPPQQPSLPA